MVKLVSLLGGNDNPINQRRSSGMQKKGMSVKRARLDEHCLDPVEVKLVDKGVQTQQPKMVRLNVGGQLFTTSLTTLNSQPDSMLGAMFSGRHGLFQDKDGAYFIDRDGSEFRHVLNFLRDGESCFLPEDSVELEELLKEAEYYQIEGPIATVKERKRKAAIRVTQRDLTSILQLERMPSPDTKTIRTDSSCALYHDPCKDLNPVYWLVDDEHGGKFVSRVAYNIVDLDDKDFTSITFAGILFLYRCSFQRTVLRNVKCPVYI